MLPVLTLTLNPTIDLTTSVDAMVPDGKLRCEAPVIEPGGGGINVARMVGELGGRATALVAVAGATGAHLKALLAEYQVEAVYLDAAGETRQSFAVHDRSEDKQYRFVLPGPPQDPLFSETVLLALDTLLAAGGIPLVVASGSLPPGLADGFYAEVAARVRASGARMIVDTSGPALHASLCEDLFLVKPDRAESRALADLFGVDPSDPIGLARAIVEDRNVEAAVVTLAADGAVLFHQGEARHLRPPRVPVVSKVGAGDSFVAALCCGLARDWPLDRAVAYGVAAAAAAVTSEGTALARKTDVERIFAEVTEEAR